MLQQAYKWIRDGENIKMDSKNSGAMSIGSLIAFIFLCAIWFLDISGLLRGLLNEF